MRRWRQNKRIVSSRDSTVLDKYSEFQGLICSQTPSGTVLSSRNSNSATVVIMELVFDSRVELTVSNWIHDNEYWCSEQMRVCREAEVVQSVGGLRTALPAST